MVSEFQSHCAVTMVCDEQKKRRRLWRYPSEEWHDIRHLRKRGFSTDEEKHERDYVNKHLEKAKMDSVDRLLR